MHTISKLTALLALLISGCGVGLIGPYAADGLDSDQVPLAAPIDDPLPPIIGSDNHSGYKAQNCNYCHELPIVGHTITDTAQCAQCHGGNGACEPNASTRTVHTPYDTCVTCHESKHDYVADCANCHFAEIGTVDCTDPPPDNPPPDDPPPDDPPPDDPPPDDPPPDDPPPDDPPPDGPPVLSTALESGCNNWPVQDFSPSNRVSTNTGLPTGSLAVDFTLRDLGGNPHTLSDMLLDKPVLLVMGAFT